MAVDLFVASATSLVKEYSCSVLLAVVEGVLVLFNGLLLAFRASLASCVLLRFGGTVAALLMCMAR